MPTILIVDDGTLDRELTAVLGHHGYRLLDIPDGVEALGIVRSGRPDLVLADILLPEPGGHHLVRRMRADADLTQPRVLFLAAAPVAAEARALARACGVSRILTTPTTAAALLKAVSAALSEPVPPASKLRQDTRPIDMQLRRVTGKVYRRLMELERTNALLNRQAVERSEQLVIARSALAQEVTKRLWAERELTQANHSLQVKAMRDTLTGLYNRGYLEESLEREASRARRSGQPFGLMMIDIDHFKRFNDTFGHAAGDAVLRTVGEYLLSLARAEDIPCRYGGEEFVLLMAHTSNATVRERAERLRQGVHALRIECDRRNVGSITTSVGIASFSSRTEDGHAVLRLADAALYRAKQAGRNRVVAAEEQADL
jgi:diguanylate cyclase (GGDEF)-like protein